MGDPYRAVGDAIRILVDCDDVARRLEGDLEERRAMAADALRRSREPSTTREDALSLAFAAQMLDQSVASLAAGIAALRGRR